MKKLHKRVNVFKRQNGSILLNYRKSKRFEDAYKAKLYKILTESKRFGRLLPILLNIPCHEGMMHAGNTYVDSSGCILVDDLVSDGVIKHSRVTERKKFELMKNASNCTIEILS